MFLELWKRQQVVIQWQWDMESYDDDEELRPQYEETVTEVKINPVTKKKEPYLPLWNKMGRCVAANSIVCLMVIPLSNYFKIINITILSHALNRRLKKIRKI